MRLAIVNQFYRPDVAPTAALAASLALHRAAGGDHVTVITGRGGYTGGAAAPDDPAANPRIRRVWTPGFGKSSHLRRLLDYAAFYTVAAGILATLPPQDVVISLTTPPLIPWAAAIHKRLHRRARLILWNMDCYPDVAERAGVIKPGGFAARFVHARNRAVFRRLDYLVCLDTAMANLLCAHYANVNPRLPVAVIPNWEDRAFFPPNAPKQPWPRAAELRLAGKFIVLYLGNMGYGHDFDTLLNAAEALRDEPVAFLFVGGGKRYDGVQREAARRNLTNVILHGYVPKEDTPAVMAAADAALVTLRDDALGVMSPSKIHANLAMRLPILYIGPATSNVDEAVERFGCGVSLRHGDVGGLVAAVRRLMTDNAEHERLRALARRAFDEAYCDGATLPLFDTVINAAAGAARLHAGTAADYGSRVRPHATPASVAQPAGTRTRAAS